MKRYAVPLLIITLVFSLAHYFIFLTVTKSMSIPALGYVMGLAVLLMPLGFLISLSPLKKQLHFMTWFGFIWLGFFQIIFFFSVVETLISVFYLHDYSYWVLIASVVISAWALFKGLRKPSLIYHKIKGPDSLKGLKLAQVSDLHVGLLHLNQKWLSGVVDRINVTAPHIVAITGDLVEGHYDDVSPQLEPLRGLNAKIEKFYITGNHEYIHGLVGRPAPWETRLADLGYRVLHNENVVVSFQRSQILFAGVPDRMAPRFDRKLQSNPDLALQTNQNVDYKILLAHEPASLWDLKTQSCDLILSGHTHGGQIFPFGALVRIAQPVVKGFKRFGSVLVFAHQGTGLWGPPMRWFTRSEIVLIEWE